MSTIQGPVLPRRRIAKELKQLRDASNMRLEEVASETEVSTSTLSRLENAQAAANALTIRALVNFYKIADTELGQNLMRWAKDGRKQGWWQDFPEKATETTTANVTLYVAYESQAAVMKMYMIPFIPVLLQTREYSKAIAERFNPTYSEGEIKALLEFWKCRQQVLTSRADQPPLELRVILDESCLTKFVGSQDVMRNQLKKLLDVTATHRNVELRVLPQSAPPHKAMKGMWTHFEFADPLDEDVAFIESHLVGLTPLEDPRDVKKSATSFTELSDLSLSLEESADLIKRVIDRFS
jgi:transcriptional regulator with XRE-family HTH domain